MTTMRDSALNIISKETIKPSSPTPSHLKTYNLSLLDLFAPSVHMPGVFFYPNNNTCSNHDKAAQLKKSLSQTLAQYYPLAGRLADGVSVDCNDEGIEFVEARINAQLSDVVRLHELEFEPVNQFFPTGRVWGYRYEASSSLVVVQLTYFSCGGLALALSMSHKIGDGSTWVSFLIHWAAVTRRNSGDHKALVLPPHFISSPKATRPLDLEVLAGTDFNNNKFFTKKFVFPNSKIAQLKANVVKEQVPGGHEKATMIPSRVELLEALLYQCAVRAAKANSGKFTKAFVLQHALNLRDRMVDPLPETSVGNIFWVASVVTIDESELALSWLTAQIKKTKSEINKVTDSQISQWVNEAIEASKNLISSNDVKVYYCSSMCGFPGYELVDFGWGKSIRATMAGTAIQNFFHLMDKPSGDGIEALVSLDEEDMAIFQNDDQLLKFTTTVKPRL